MFTLSPFAAPLVGPHHSGVKNNRWERAMKEKKAKNHTTQVTVDIIDGFENRYLSAAEYINYEVIS